MKSCRADVRIKIGKRPAKSASSPHDSAVLASMYSALKPDVGAKGKLSEPGTKAEIALERNSIIFGIESKDLATLRATLNSYLRLADASYKCISG